MKIATVILLALSFSTFAAVVESGIDSKQAEITSTGIAGMSITAARSGAGEVPRDDVEQGRVEFGGEFRIGSLTDVR